MLSEIFAGNARDFFQDLAYKFRNHKVQPQGLIFCNKFALFRHQSLHQCYRHDVDGKRT
jgi:hypothetical protein